MVRSSLFLFLLPVVSGEEGGKCPVKQTCNDVVNPVKERVDQKPYHYTDERLSHKQVRYTPTRKALEYQRNAAIAKSQASSTPLSFLQTGSPSKPLSYSVEARTLPAVKHEILDRGYYLAWAPGHAISEDGFSVYNLDFKPGKFTCSSCDVTTCTECNIVCDIASCQTEFFQTECWCRKDRDIKLHKDLWQLREKDGQFLAQDSLRKFFCDETCGGAGICALDGLQCKRREDACKPWWWCDLPPPAEEEDLHPTDGWGDGMTYISTFLQTFSMSKKAVVNQNHQGVLQNHRGAKRALTQVRSQTGAGVESQMGRKKKTTYFEPNDKGNFAFEAGSWSCDDADLPPKIQNPSTYLWEDRGYIVMPKASCRGSAFDTKCYCFDEASWLHGGDPMTSEAMCDSACGMGQCASGLKCGADPPGPPPPQSPPPVIDPIEAEVLGEKDLKKGTGQIKITMGS